MVGKDIFVKEYVNAILDGNAAVFAGAGLSKASGFVDWKELLQPFAKEIGINIADEPDLTRVAQYVVNNAGNRGPINSKIIDEFSKDISNNENINILTRLPIYTYWTTNYDQLIECGLKNSNRNADVKINYKQLAVTKKDRDAIVYKMHGDAAFPAEAVITKDDYVKYDKSHPFFKTVFQGDLISKTFMFIGFSFEDPNFDSIINQVRLIMGDDLRNHYWLTKKVKREDIDIKDDEDFGYKSAIQELRIQDLNRYGIQTVLFEDFSEITDTLRDIETAVLTNSIFISGSIESFSDKWPKEKVEQLAYKLANSLVKEEYKVTSGFGLGVGSFVINGALDEIFESKYKHCDEHLCLRPFPQGIMDANERKERWTKYREEILDNNGTVIFIFGNKCNADNKKIVADGCIQEFKIAKDKKRVIIPIGSTDDAAASIYESIKSNIDEYKYLEKYIEELGSETDVDKIVEMVLDILKGIRSGGKGQV